MDMLTIRKRGPAHPAEPAPGEVFPAPADPWSACSRVEPLFLALEIGDFPAQALAAWDPSLRDRAFAVVDQDPDNHKTHVLACSPEARALGVRPGMPYTAVRRRWRRVPALFRSLPWEAALREELGALCYRHTPGYEIRDDGSAILDLAGTPALRDALRTPGARDAGRRDRVPEDAEGRACLLLARRLQREIRFKTGLTDVALGLAATRLMARVMARQAHPAGLRICPPGLEARTLGPMDPGILPGLSPQCRERIRRYAFASIGQIQSLGRQAMAARFGSEGDKLYTLACGLDLARAAAGKRGISAETVLEEDLNDDDALARKVRLTADKLAFRLRKEGAVAARITVAIRYSDHKAARKTVAVAPATDGFKELSERALEGFRAVYARRVALRSIALIVARPGMEKGQVDLFEGQGDRKARAIGEALTRIRGRGGFAAIGLAGS